jgi:hypothetical protein
MTGKVVHWQQRRCDIYIGRPGYGPIEIHLGWPKYHWGNPFVVGEDGTQEEVVEKFRQWIRGYNYFFIEPGRRHWILNNLQLLQGRILGCWCKPDKVCHGDVYLELLNDPSW